MKKLQKIIEFKPKETSKDFWEKYFEFTETNFRERYPNDPLPDREALKQRQETDILDLHLKRWLAITSDDKIVGWAGFGAVKEDTPEYEVNKDLAQINIRILTKYRRKGIGTQLLKVLVKEAMKHNRTIIETGSDTEAGKAFLKKFGATKTIEGAENRLDMADVDWDMIQSWVDEGSKRAEGAIIETFFECPDEILEEFAEMYTEALNMQPLGETEYRSNINGNLRKQHEIREKELGRINYTMISKEKDGKISGITEIYYDKRDAHRIFQGLTGVRPKFRGKGLGKWLKALMIQYIKDNFPDVEVVITGNAESNEAMLSINERMGFKKYRGGEGYKLQVEELAKKLNLQNKRNVG